ncbi:TPA: hypothetical protein H7W12_001242 [Escherichia coli]|uniref:hypothetical protein n=1 Tax=Enterobacteriaceae TaxID=543 RepID=UPI000BE527E8|nr:MULTISPECIES: hypothetical protein [Enterobacteriaceae]EEY2495083.1 hypothetical protein [Escherichia coli]EFD1402021.1 hypothetical protein [Escherichia coli]EFW7444373.1 hypothetical protein [Shigella sonnei]EGF1722178.1 hypothetical protein [Escherichia coli]EGI4506868.1 hypothetical protein [Escherichia coli]
MAGWESIIAVIIALGAFIWNIIRDKSADFKTFESRLAKIESDLVHTKSDVERLERGQDDLESALNDLRSQIHSMDLKIERVIAILEKK